GWDPPAVGGRIVWSVQREIRERAVHPSPPVTCRAALHGTAHNHLVAAPGMVASGIRGGLKRAAEIRERKRSDVVRHSQLVCGIEKSLHGRAHLAQQALLNTDLVAVRVKSAEGAEKHLTIHTELTLHGNDLCDLLELIPDGSRRERRGERVHTFQRASQILALRDGKHRDVARWLDERDA